MLQRNIGGGGEGVIDMYTYKSFFYNSMSFSVFAVIMLVRGLLSKITGGYFLDGYAVFLAIAFFVAAFLSRMKVLHLKKMGDRTNDSSNLRFIVFFYLHVFSPIFMYTIIASKSN